MDSKVATTPPIKMGGVYDILNDDKVSDSSTEEIKEMISSKPFTNRVRSECFNTNMMDFAENEHSESSDEETKVKTTIFSAGYSISKEGEE